MRFYHYQPMQRLLARRQAGGDTLNHLFQQALVKKGNDVSVPVTDRCDDAVKGCIPVVCPLIWNVSASPTYSDF